MKILIVHDREPVLLKCKSTIESIPIHIDRIDEAHDGIDARKFLQQNVYDLAIIDLTIAHIKNKTETSHVIAEELLQELFHMHTLNTPGDIIGLTFEANVLEKIDTNIGRHLMTIIEETSDDSWISQLKDRVLYAHSSAQSRQRSLFNRYDYDVLILTALDEEFEPYKEIFELRPHPFVPNVYSFLFRDKNNELRRGIASSIGRAGQASAASATQSLITQFRPKFCLMSGFCGGIKQKIALGEIAMCEIVFDWDYGKWKTEDGRSVFFPRPEPIGIRHSRAHNVARNLESSGLPITSSELNEIKGLSSGLIQKVEIKLRPFASGSAVVGNDEIAHRLNKLSDNIAAVDMESFGFYYAGSNTTVVRPEMLCVKAVSDFCDGDKNDDLHEVCSFISAKAVECILKKNWTFDL